MRGIQFIIAFLLVATNVASAQTEFEKLAAESNPVIQSQISSIYDTLRKPGDATQRKIDLLNEARRLKESTSDTGELLKQLAIFVGTAQENEEFHVLLALHVLRSLDIQPSVVIRGLAPHLDSDNEQVRAFARDWFRSHDGAGTDSPMVPVNYQEYAEYIGQKRARNEEIPVSFAEYLFERSPQRALIAFDHGNLARDVVPRLQAIARNLQYAKQEGKLLERGATPPPIEKKKPSEILLAAHIVDNAIWLQKNGHDDLFRKALPEVGEQLAKLSNHNEWWVRLYVAEIMRRHPELRQADVLEKLRDDSSESVSKVAKLTQG